MKRLLIALLFCSYGYAQTIDTVRTSDTPNQGRLKWNAAVGYIAPVFNVKSAPFNAKGDGLTDATIGIQMALDSAVASGGGEVHIPPGTFLYSRLHLKYASNISIVGSNSGSSILKTNSTSGVAIQIGDSTNKGNANGDSLTSYNFRMSDIGLRRTATSSAITFIKFTNHESANIDRVHIDGEDHVGTGGVSVGMLFSGCAFTKINDCQSFFTAGTAVRIRYSQDLYIKHAMIAVSGGSGNAVQIDTCGNGAINIDGSEILGGNYTLYISNSNYSRIQNTYIDSGEWGAWVGGHSTLITFSNSWFSPTRYDGLVIDSAVSVTVTGSQFANKCRNGIVLNSGASSINITGNQFNGINANDSTNGSGVMVNSDWAGAISFIATGNSFNNNNFGGHQKYAFYIKQGLLAHYVIEHNEFRGMETGNILDSATAVSRYVGRNTGDYTYKHETPTDFWMPQTADLNHDATGKMFGMLRDGVRAWSVRIDSAGALNFYDENYPLTHLRVSPTGLVNISNQLDVANNATIGGTLTAGAIAGAVDATYITKSFSAAARDATYVPGTLATDSWSINWQPASELSTLPGGKIWIYAKTDSTIALCDTACSTQYTMTRLK